MLPKKPKEWIRHYQNVFQSKIWILCETCVIRSWWVMGEADVCRTFLRSLGVLQTSSKTQVTSSNMVEILDEVTYAGNDLTGNGIEIIQDGDRKRKGRHFPPPSAMGIEKLPIYYLCHLEMYLEERIDYICEVWGTCMNWYAVLGDRCQDHHAQQQNFKNVDNLWSSFGVTCSNTLELQILYFRNEAGSLSVKGIFLGRFVPTSMKKLLNTLVISVLSMPVLHAYWIYL